MAPCLSLSSLYLLLQIVGTKKISRASIFNQVERPEELSGRFRTVRPLALDTRNRRKFIWARTWSTITSDLQTLRDGQELLLTIDAAKAEVPLHLRPRI